MIFVFRSGDNIIEKEFPIGKCPPEIIEDNLVYTRVFTVPNVIVDLSKPKTLGSLADANSLKMEKEGTLPKPKIKPKPWWRKDKKKIDTSLAKMSDKQKARYIEEGKK